MGAGEWNLSCTISQIPRSLLQKNKDSVHAVWQSLVCAISPAAMLEWSQSHRWHSSLRRQNAWLRPNTGRQLRKEKWLKGSPHCHFSLCLRRWCLGLADCSTLSATRLVSVNVVRMNKGWRAETAETEFWEDCLSQLRSAFPLEWPSSSHVDFRLSSWSVPRLKTPLCCVACKATSHIPHILLFFFLSHFV